MTKLVGRFEADPGQTTVLWRIASHDAAQVGDRVYLFKQGSDPRGIFGVGEIIEPPRLQVDETDSDEPKYRARIIFNNLVDPSEDFLLHYDVIKHVVPDTLISAMASGYSVPDPVAAELENLLVLFLGGLPSISASQADDPAFDPDSVHDERERAIRAIRLRRGQPAFREALMHAYRRRCVITGCAIEDVLEAAHITPYLGTLTNHVSNGLLLRADLHTLFDCGLLAIEPKTRKVVIAARLKTSSYSGVAGRTIRQPKDPINGPSQRNLEKRYRAFQAMNGGVGRSPDP